MNGEKKWSNSNVHTSQSYKFNNNNQKYKKIQRKENNNKKQINLKYYSHRVRIV